MAKTNEIATQDTQVELTSPKAILGFATTLKQLIVDNKLYTNIKGKNYVNVEGWQIAGAFTGTFPIVEKVEDLSSDVPKNEKFTNKPYYKFRAEVTLRDANNNVVGSGMAICTNREAGKSGFDEYAVASMAQTRAVGKAFRMKIGWLLKVAGYETTPAEEMDFAREAEVVDVEPNPQLTPEEREAEEWAVLNKGLNVPVKISFCRTQEELMDLWNELPKLIRAKYKNDFTDKRKKLEDMNRAPEATAEE